MGLFEKIEYDPIEPDNLSAISRSSQRWTDETLVISYGSWEKVKALFYLLLALFFSFMLFAEGSFILQIMAGGLIVFSVWYLSQVLLTRDITFTPDGIVTKGFIGETVIPARALVMNVTDNLICLSHGSIKNYRESIIIPCSLVTAEQCSDIVAYGEDVYQVKTTPSTSGATAGGSPRANHLALVAYHKAVTSYRTMSAFFVIFTLVAFFTVVLTDRFFGLAPQLPHLLVRLLCIVLAMAGFVALKSLSTTPVNAAGAEPIEKRLRRVENASFMCAVVSNGIAFLGLLLLLLLGNMVDFWVFTIIGVLSFCDFHPRFSIWEQSVKGTEPAKGEGTPGVSVPLRRSFQVSLVLMGTLAVASYGEDSRYLYKNRQDCVDDWGEENCQECQDTTGGGSGGGHYYGPRYGSGGGRATRAVGVHSVSRGGFGSLGRFHASFGG